jgi:hypothetical protein
MKSFNKTLQIGLSFTWHHSIKEIHNDDWIDDFNGLHNWTSI